MFLLVLIHPTVRKKIPKICGAFTSEYQWESQQILEIQLYVFLPAELYLQKLNKQFKQVMKLTQFKNTEASHFKLAEVIV